ncbi:MAG: PEP-CTERM sorting domain-containing protein [Planctomycetota bacterium]|nr:PEP-CTERM sorting domain-containing protein [Planctomycetota bacterium]
MSSIFGVSRRLCCVALLACFVSATPAFGDLINGSVDVTGSRATPQYTVGDDTYGAFGWNFSYTRSFDGTKLTKHLEIDFQFDAALNYDAAQKAAFKAAAEANIENQWNNKASIKDETTGISYPITVDVTTAGPFNQTVQVHLSTGNDPTDMTNWYSADTPAVQAHEFGHMLGLFDEYLGGAVNQYPDPLLSNDGLMGLGALNANPVMYPRYYQQYLDYMYELNPTEDFTMTIVPEPATWLLVVVGLLGMVAVTYRRRVAA